MNNFITDTCEKSIISILLLDCDQFEKVSSVVNANDFSDVSLRTIFQMLVFFDKNGTKWTWQFVADSLKSVDDRPTSLEYPVFYITELISNMAVSAQDINFHLKVLLEKKTRVKIKRFISTFSDSVDDPSKNMLGLYDEFFTGGDIFGQVGFGRHRVVNSENLWTELKKDIEELSVTKFVGTGYDSVDENLAWGFAAGQLSIITGRPSMGKSTFRSNIQRNLSDLGIHSITVTKEQSIRQEYFRLIALSTGLSIQEVRKVNDWRDDVTFDKIMNSIKHMSGNWPHTIIEPRGLFFVKDLRRSVLEERGKGNDPKVVFVDLFSQLDDINNANPAYKSFVIQQKIIELADVAKDLGVHFCLVVQLSRLGKDRERVDPREHLKESGAYEERADLVFLVERPAYYKPDEIEDNHIVIRILKQRDGPIKSLKLDFDPLSLLISDRSDVDNNSSGRVL